MSSINLRAAVFFLALALSTSGNPGFAQVVHAPNLQDRAQMLQTIQHLTSDSTLLELVRRYDLVGAFQEQSEEAAVDRLGGMIDIVEDVDGNALEISIVTDGSDLGVTLTDALAGAVASAPGPGAEKLGKAEAAALMLQMQQQETRVERARQRFMSVMKETGYVDPAVKRTMGHEEEGSVPEEVARAKRSYEQQLNLLNFLRESLMVAEPPPQQIISNKPLNEHREPQEEPVPGAGDHHTPQPPPPPATNKASNPHPEPLSNDNPSTWLWLLLLVATLVWWQISRYRRLRRQTAQEQ